MECPSCFEMYDQDKHVPLNFPCGHTFCRICIMILEGQYQNIKCPICGLEFKLMGIHRLSKNYIALGLADDTRNSLKAALPPEELCELHKEPLRYYCKTCKSNMCPSCIVEHSGHQFIKIEHSSGVLRQKLVQSEEQLQELEEVLFSAQDELDRQWAQMEQREKQQTEVVETQLNHLVKLVMEHGQHLTDTLKNQASVDRARLQERQAKVREATETLQRHQQQAAGLKAGLEEEEGFDPQGSKETLVTLEKELLVAMERGGHLQREVLSQTKEEAFHLQVDYIQMANARRIVRAEPAGRDRLCLFGYKDKMLELDLHTQEWSLKSLKAAGGPHLEFQYYSAAVSTSCGEVILTGGSATRQVVAVDLQKRETRELASMAECRKEHCAVILHDTIYALGGYNAQTNKFLEKCEKYSLVEDEWSPMAPMSMQRCAFSSCLVESQLKIYVFGGYTGSKRIAEIEVYSIEKDEWLTYSLQLQFPLSNSAAVYNPVKHQIVLLGGGHSDGFLNHIYIFDLATDSVSVRQNHNEGKDLRNKLVYHEGQAYLVGGHQHQLERISLRDYSQTRLANSYAHLLEDNLDSWAACLTSYNPHLPPSNAHPILMLDAVKRYS